MKIWCQLPVQLPLPEFQPFDELIQKHYQLVKNPDTEVVIRDVPTGLRAGSMSYLGLKLLQIYIAMMVSNMGIGIPAMSMIFDNSTGKRAPGVLVHK